MIQHYEGELGVFDYDDTEFKLRPLPTFPDRYFLSYIGSETDGSKISVPEGLINGIYTFYNAEITSIPKLPKSLRKAQCMFLGCKHIKKGCELPQYLVLATSMFQECFALEDFDFYLPDTLIYCREMFLSCLSLSKQPKNLPKYMQDGQSMFRNCVNLKKTIDGDIKNKDVSMMYYNCRNLEFCTYPIVKIANECNQYRKRQQISNMFSGCDSLKFTYRKQKDWYRDVHRCCTKIGLIQNIVMTEMFSLVMKNMNPTTLEDYFSVEFLKV